MICWRFLANWCPYVDLFRTPPFPKIRGKYVQKACLFKNLIETRGFVKKLEYIQNLKGTSQITYEIPCLRKLRTFIEPMSYAHPNSKEPKTT